MQIQLTADIYSGVGGQRVRSVHQDLAWALKVVFKVQHNPASNQATFVPLYWLKFGEEYNS